MDLDSCKNGCHQLGRPQQELTEREMWHVCPANLLHRPRSTMLCAGDLLKQKQHCWLCSCGLISTDSQQSWLVCLKATILLFWFRMVYMAYVWKHYCMVSLDEDIHAHGDVTANAKAGIFTFCGCLCQSCEAPRQQPKRKLEEHWR